MNNELKTCPFCGGEAFVGGYDAYSCDSSFDAIECSKCGAMSAPCSGDSEIEQAVRDWNTRPPKQNCADEMYHTLESILCIIKLGEAQNGNGQLGRYKNSIEQLLTKARGGL